MQLSITFLIFVRIIKKKVKMTSNKQEALDRLSVIEREQVELRKAIEKFDQRSVFDIKNFSDVVEMAREKGYV